MVTWSLSPFLNEVDVLEIRLAELDPVVDIFVLVEAHQTHTGIPRDLTFPGEERFDPWRAKIRYLSIDFPPGLSSWGRENYQREALGAALKGLADDDLVLISDVDEIPRADLVRQMKDRVRQPVAVSFPIHPYQLDWRWDVLEDGFCRCTFIRGSELRRRDDGFYMGCQAAISPSFCAFSAERDCAGHSHLVGDYGWHFTYIGNEDAILAKAASIADAEVKGITRQAARLAVGLGRDPFGRDRTAHRVPLEQLPVYVQENHERFRHLTGLPA